MTDDTEPKGRAKGAIVLAESMTPEQLQERARAGAAARWAKPLVATYRGNFKDAVGLDVDCYVLNDYSKTPVISQTGMAKALGMSTRGNAFPRFMASKAMVQAAGAELVEKLQKTVVFQGGSGGADQPPSMINGYDAALLIDVCNAISAARSTGALAGERYKKIAQHAATLTAASAKAGIRGFVYAIAGYNPSAQEVIAAFKMYVKEEAKKYEQEFPQELYVAWHRLYKIPVPVRGKPWHFKKLTLEHIYFPLAKSNGKILELVRAEKARDDDRRKKLFQFLSDIGTRALRMHIGRVLEMAESSSSSDDYEGKIVARFGGQQGLDLVMPYEDTTPAQQST